MTQPAASGLSDAIEGQPLAGRHVLMIVENLPLPFDRRVWQEARTLTAAGAKVSIVCPKGKGFEAPFEHIEGVDIYRHSLPLEASGALGFALEYGAALFWEMWLAWRIFFKQRFHVIHGCNPPDLIFLVALPFKLFGVKFLFDHHDINPELYEAKFGKRGPFWKLMVWLEKLTFRSADVSIATNESYRSIAIERGKMDSGKVHVVRSDPDLSRLTRVPPVPSWKNGRAHMVGYVGVMGAQEGIDLLINALDHIVHKLGRKDIQFVLVGGGPSLPMLKQLTEEKQLSPFITFTGRAPDAVLFEVLSTMDLGVNPDRVNVMNDKSTMNKVMEYMASNRLLITHCAIKQCWQWWPMPWWYCSIGRELIRRLRYDPLVMALNAVGPRHHHDFFSARPAGALHPGIGALGPRPIRQLQSGAFFPASAGQ